MSVLLTSELEISSQSIDCCEQIGLNQCQEVIPGLRIASIFIQIIYLFLKSVKSLLEKLHCSKSGCLILSLQVCHKDPAEPCVLSGGDRGQG